MKSFIWISTQYNPSYCPNFYFILLHKRLQFALCVALLPRREPEAWEVGFRHDYDPALEEGVFGDVEMLRNGLNCCGEMRANR